MANAFENNVGAVTAREYAHACDARFGCCELSEIDRVVGSELLGEFQAMRGAADNRDARRAGGFSNGEGCDANRSGTLHNHSVLPIDASAFDAVDGGDERATSANDAFGGKFVGNFEDVCGGPEV